MQDKYIKLIEIKALDKRKRSQKVTNKILKVQNRRKRP